MQSYRIYENGRIRRGDARDLLEQIRDKFAQDNDEIKQMTVEQYAIALIEDAPYFLEDDFLRDAAFSRFQCEFEQALTYLAAMPTSGIHILFGDEPMTV